MPIHEYLCNDCRRRFSALVGVVADAAAVTCPRCGGRSLRKLMSRFASFRADGDLEDLADLGDMDDDPRAAGRWARKMSREFGEDLGPDFEDEFEAALEEDHQGSLESADEDDEL